jgi:hypothetical protein
MWHTIAVNGGTRLSTQCVLCDQTWGAGHALWQQEVGQGSGCGAVAHRGSGTAVCPAPSDMLKWCVCVADTLKVTGHYCCVAWHAMHPCRGAASCN